ncbi:alpha/beta hydrolase [Paraglaciecola sp.]|uniref:alpha/beta hydrolase n=1 Tax=Paraglaciecola sp. TaxID=1920173 RepID=UPI003EF31797
MINRIKLYWFVALLISIQLQAKPVAWEKLQGLGQVEYFELKNAHKTKNNLPYHIFVRLPEEYHQDKQQQFPVLYLTDGGTNFPLFAANYTHLRWMDDIPPMIVVGISYGTHDWKKGNDRSHDFTVPSKERDHWGGAQVFEQFFIDYLMPTINNKYRVQTDKQILYGQSLGGQFGLYSSMYGKVPFYGVIASNPALHRNLQYFKQPLRARKNRPKVFVSLAEFDAKQYKEPAENWLDFWQKQPQVWPDKISRLAAHNHLSATPDAIRNGLVWLFDESSSTSGNVTHIDNTPIKNTPINNSTGK